MFLGFGTVLAADTSSITRVAEDQTKQLIENLYGNGEIREISDILLGTNSGFYEAMVGSETSIGSIVMGITKAVASGLLLVNTLISIIQGAEKGEGNLDFFYRVLIKLVLAFFVIIYLNDIIDAIQKLGYYMVQIMNDTCIEALGYFSESEMDELLSDFQTMGFADETSFWQWQSNMLEVMSLYNPILSLLKLSIKTVSYSFFIELALRKAFMPIAMVMIIEEGPRSPGVRYLKKFFAVYLKMMFCILSVTASYALTMATVNAKGDGFVDYISTGATFIYDSFATKGAALVFIRQGSMLADEILGTN